MNSIRSMMIMVWSYITREVQKPTKRERIFMIGMGSLSDIRIQIIWKNITRMRTASMNTMNCMILPGMKSLRTGKICITGWVRDTSLKTPGSAPTRLQMIHSIRSKWTVRQMF